MIDIKQIKFRRSASGVPHIVIETKDETYSATFFSSAKKWKLWSGYASGENKKIYSKEFELGDTISLEDIINNPNR